MRSCPNAFWLLPAGTDANGGWGYAEIDIMETVGRENGQVFQAVHGAANAGNYASVNVLGDGFHTFGLNWSKDFLTWYVDGVKTWEIPTPADMNQPMVLIANQAVGGAWAGTPDFGADGVSDFKLDYIHVFGPASDPGRVINGTRSVDNLMGGRGADTISGSDGADMIIGSKGADRLTGGKGDDHFFFSKGDGADVITDFTTTSREHRLYLDWDLGHMNVTKGKDGLLLTFDDAPGDSILLAGLKNAGVFLNEPSNWIFI